MWISHPQNMIGEKKEKTATVYNPCDRKAEREQQGGRGGGEISNDKDKEQKHSPHNTQICVRERKEKPEFRLEKAEAV